MIRQVFLLFLTWKEIFIASERCLKNNVTGKVDSQCGRKHKEFCGQVIKLIVLN